MIKREQKVKLNKVQSKITFRNWLEESVEVSLLEVIFGHTKPRLFDDLVGCLQINCLRDKERSIDPVKLLPVRDEVLQERFLGLLGDVRKQHWDVVFKKIRVVS
jgi:hypothetical protein